jgi:hypothetical protein
MKVGTIIYATDSGLGILAKDFYDNGIITDVLVQSHGTLKNNLHWYKNSSVLSPVENIATSKNSTPEHKKNLINDFLEKIDILFLFEIEWYSDIVQEARKRGKKVIFMPMYECSPFPILADCYLTTSDLDHQYYNKMYSGLNVERINVPVNSSVVWKKRSCANVFVHNAGNLRQGDRNGTQAILNSIEFIKSKNIKIIIRSQHDNIKFNNLDSRVTIDISNKKFEDLWSEGDVFLFPERWNGLSLPLQEAHASGMMVMCGDRFPVNTWLPAEPLIKVNSYTKKSIIKNIPFKSADYNPIEIANTIDKFANKNIEKYSLIGKKWSEKNSWNVMKKKYLQIIQKIYEN